MHKSTVIGCIAETSWGLSYRITDTAFLEQNGDLMAISWPGSVRFLGLNGRFRHLLPNLHFFKWCASWHNANRGIIEGSYLADRCPCTRNFTK